MLSRSLVYQCMCEVEAHYLLKVYREGHDSKCLVKITRVNCQASRIFNTLSALAIVRSTKLVSS